MKDLNIEGYIKERTSQERRMEMKRLHSEGLSLSQISEKFGVSRQYVYMMISDKDIDVHVQNKMKRQNRNKEIEKLRDEGLNYAEIARKTGVTSVTVKAVLGEGANFYKIKYPIVKDYLVKNNINIKALYEKIKDQIPDLEYYDYTGILYGTRLMSLDLRDALLSVLPKGTRKQDIIYDGEIKKNFDYKGIPNKQIVEYLKTHYISFSSLIIDVSGKTGKRTIQQYRNACFKPMDNEDKLRKRDYYVNKILAFISEGSDSGGVEENGRE